MWEILVEHGVDPRVDARDAAAVAAEIAAATDLEFSAKQTDADSSQSG